MKKRLGFTLVEVSLFLGITALLFVGITIGTQNSINQQRHSDAVNGFVDFIRDTYSEVSNPQSTGHGNSTKAIYGRLIVFGEEYSIDKDDQGRVKQNEGRRDVYIYDVLGNANENGASDSLQSLLTSVNASIFGIQRTGENIGSSMFGAKLVPAGVAEAYSPRWQSKVELVAKNSIAKMAILIVRHPRSGTINTLVLDETLEANTILHNSETATFVLDNNEDCKAGQNCQVYKNARNLLKDKMDAFSTKEVDLCLNIFGDGNIRRNIRIAENARNAAGVQIIDNDSSDNKCK